MSSAARNLASCRATGAGLMSAEHPDLHRASTSSPHHLRTVTLSRGVTASRASLEGAVCAAAAGHATPLGGGLLASVSVPQPSASLRVSPHNDRCRLGGGLIRGEGFMKRQMPWALLAGRCCLAPCARHGLSGRADDHESGVSGPDVGQRFLAGGLP